MAILRDVLAHFDVFVNLEPLSALDKKIKIIRRNILSFAAATSTVMAGAGYGLYKLVDAASDAAEQLNVLETVFKDNSAAVIEWSRTVGKEMGRSEFSFQDSVGKFGAFLGAQLRGTDADFEQMSKRLSELTVDLASFYNTTDKEAQMRLFSGMSGETEAVRRFGIDISDSALDEFNRAQGDTRTMRALNLKEKMLLRYKKILIDTEQAQGDAVKTADSWANQVKRLQENLKTAAVLLGQRVLPILNKGLKAINGMVSGVEEAISFIEDKTSILRTAVTVLASLTAAMAIATVIQNWEHLKVIVFSVGEILKMKVLPHIIAMRYEAMKAAAAFLAIEDIITFLRGGESVTGNLLKAVTKLNDPLVVVRKTADAIMTAIGNAVARAVNLITLIPKLGEALGALVAGDRDAFRRLDKELPAHMNKGVVDLAAREKLLEENRKTNWNAAVLSGDAAGAIAARREGTEDQYDALARFKTERQEMIRKGARGLELNQKDVDAGFVDPAFLKAISDYSAGGSKAAKAVSGVAPAAAGAPRVGVQNIKIDVHSSKADAKQVADEVLDKMMREASAAEGEEF